MQIILTTPLRLKSIVDVKIESTLQTKSIIF